VEGTITSLLGYLSKQRSYGSAAVWCEVAVPRDSRPLEGAACDLIAPVHAACLSQVDHVDGAITVSLIAPSPLKVEVDHLARDHLAEEHPKAFLIRLVPRLC
jgi:hypothetical protein